MPARFDSVAILASKPEIGAKKWRSAMVASSSVLALAAFAGSDKALAANECGAPASGIVTCNAVAYPTGISYTGFDDLTVNVGSFAGQNAPVAVGGEISVNQTDTVPVSQSLYVGSNVTLNSATFGESVYAKSNGYNAYSNITNHAAITSTGTGIAGFAEAYNSPYITAGASIVNTGDITTSAAGAYGLTVSSLTTAEGIYSYGAANASATNSGTIKTAGTSAFALGSYATSHSYAAYYAFATANASISNSGPLTTTGNYADGIEVHSVAVADVVAPFSSSSPYKNLAYATASSYAYNKGPISVSGTGSVGIFGSSKAYAGYDATGARTTYTPFNATAIATTTIVNEGAITVTGDKGTGAINGPDGIYAYAKTLSIGYDNSYSHSTVSVTNSGTIKVSGSYGAGIAGVSFAKSDSYYGDAIAATSISNTGAVTTFGATAPALIASSTAYGYGTETGTAKAIASVTNSGTINTYGANSPGLVATSITLAGAGFESSAYSQTYVNNSGGIFTGPGANSPGIVLFSYSQSEAEIAGAGTNAIVVNSGPIGTGSDYSDGILVQSIAKAFSNGGETEVTALASVTNSGPITTSGYKSDGIAVITTAYSQPYSYASSNGESYATTGVTVTNSGAIVTSGDNSAGIRVTNSALGYSYYGGTSVANTTIVNNANITTSGYKSYGIYAGTVATNIGIVGPLPLPILGNTYATATTTITNTKAINTKGDYASGIVAKSYAFAVGGYNAVAMATTTVTNSGPITTSGYEAHGIVAFSTALASGYAPTATATATVNNNGPITVTGDGSDGILVEATASQNYGTGISTATVNNSGSVSASGANGTGVVARGYNVYVNNLAGGTISGGTGASGAGVAAYGTYTTVTNAGTISSLNNQAIIIGATDATLDNQLGGTITGFVIAHADSMTFANYGTWNAVGGNSDFTPTGGGSSIIVNKGSVFITGNQTLVGLTEFDNFGLLSLAQTNAHAGPRPQFETLTVTGDFVGNNGIVEVGSNMTTTADVLKATGTISGLDYLKVSPEGTPGLTTGNGILVVDASTGITSATNFKILSNDSNNTFVDGAYQYSLVFDPGAGGTGQWFLTSKFFGGVYPLGQVGSFAMSTFNVSVMDLPNIVDLEEDNQEQMASNQPPVQLASNNNDFVPTGSGTPGIGGWARFNYASLNVNPSGPSFSDYHMTSSIGHFAIDETIHANGQTGIFGITAGPVSANANFNDFGVHMHTSGYYLGGYGVWLSGPWTAGVLLEYAGLDTGITDPTIGTNAKVQPDVWGFQGEVRYRTHVMDDFTLEPWGELTYSRVNSVNFVDGASNLINVGATESIDTRLGARLSTVVQMYGTTFKPYGDVGLDYEFDGRSTIVTDGFLAETSLSGATGHFGGGLNALITDKISVYGQADYLAGEHQTGWTGFVGFRYQE